MLHKIIIILALMCSVAEGSYFQVQSTFDQPIPTTGLQVMPDSDAYINLLTKKIAGEGRASTTALGSEYGESVWLAVPSDPYVTVIIEPMDFVFINTVDVCDAFNPPVTQDECRQEIQTLGGTPFPLMNDTSDWMYVGDIYKVDSVIFRLSQLADPGDYTLSAQYCSANSVAASTCDTWTSLSITDNTTGFSSASCTTDCRINFTQPGNWVISQENNIGGRYYLRIRTSSTPSPVAQAYFIQEGDNDGIAAINGWNIVQWPAGAKGPGQDTRFCPDGDGSDFDGRLVTMSSDGKWEWDFYQAYICANTQDPDKPWQDGKYHAGSVRMRARNADAVAEQIAGTWWETGNGIDPVEDLGGGVYDQYDGLGSANLCSSSANSQGLVTRVEYDAAVIAGDSGDFGHAIWFDVPGVGPEASHYSHYPCMRGSSIAPFWFIHGTHNGSNGAATLQSIAFKHPNNQSVSASHLVGFHVYNQSAGDSTCVITANTTTTATCILTGGTRQTWNSGDSYFITIEDANTKWFKNGSRLHIKPSYDCLTSSPDYWTTATHGGTHTGGASTTVLTISPSVWTANELVGLTITNLSGGTCVVNSNTASTVTCQDPLSGGNSWNSGESYSIYNKGWLMKRKVCNTGKKYGFIMRAITGYDSKSFHFESDDGRSTLWSGVEFQANSNGILPAGVWSPTNMQVVYPVCGDSRVCLNDTSGTTDTTPPANPTTLAGQSTYGSNTVSNPGFESGASSWTWYTNGTGSFVSDANPYSGTYGGHVTTTTMPTNPPTANPNVQLYQANISLDASSVYELTFWAKQSAGRNLKMRLIKNVNPYTNYGINDVVVDVQSTWTQHTIRFTTSGFTGTATDARLMFWFYGNAQDGDEYFFDDIVLRKMNLTASFTWTANVEGDLAGYKLHYGTQSGVYDTVINVGNYAYYNNLALSEGVTYYFAVTAYDTSGNQSGYSNQIQLPLTITDPDTPGRGYHRRNGRGGIPW